MKLDKDTVATVLQSLTEIAKGEFEISDEELETLALEDELQAELFMGLQMLQDTIQYQHQQLKESEDKLRNEKEKVEQSMIYKDQFLANMSHEIRTPLNGIIGLNEVLEGTSLDDEQKGILRNVRKSGESLMVIINDILDFSKIEAGKLELEFKSFHFFEFIDQIKALFEPKVDMKGLRFNIYIADDISEYIVSDETRLKQVVINLIGNAIKFTNKGEVNLKIKLSEGKDKLCFEISDTGIGIKEEDLSKVFNSFDQADSSITRKYGGTGLGLNITKSLVGFLGGNIHVKSEFGRGSIFSFTVDYKLGETTNESDVNVGPDDLSDLQVLVAEDNLVNQQLVKFLLDGMNIPHTIVSNGKKALDFVQENEVDVVLMDVQMPEMDGLESTRQMRCLEEGSPYIIALTANAYKKDREKCLSVGMNDYLSKPINKELLIAALAKGKREINK